MKNPTFDALRYQANALGWSVNIDKNSDDDEVIVSFEKTSPAGEDFSFDIWVKPNASLTSIRKEIEDWALDFDPETHAAIWYMGENRGQPKSIRDLLEDADAIKEMVENLSEKIDEIELCSETKKFCVILDWFILEYVENKTANPNELPFEDFIKSKERPFFNDVYALAVSSDGFIRECDDCVTAEESMIEVCFSVRGYFKVSIKTNDIETAKKIAEQCFSEADFGELEDADGDLYWVENDNGGRVYER